MIFSMLNLRKKTSATVAGVVIAGLCLWGVAMWHNMSRGEILNILLGSVLLVLAIIGMAFLLIVCFKLIGKMLGKVFGNDEDSTPGQG